MLKRIDPSQAELGMFIHKLEGSWLKRPFWKTKFVINDPQVLADLRESNIEAVVIDVSRGVDISPAARPMASPAGPSPTGSPPCTKPLIPALTRTPAFSFPSSKPQVSAKEFGNAAKVADRKRKIVTQVFLETRLGKWVQLNTVEPVIEEIFASLKRNPHAFNGLMRCRQETEGVYRHALACSALMISLAKQMKFSPNRILEAGLAGLLFDLGINQLPIDLTHYKDDFYSIPHDIMREHTALGYNFLIASGLPEELAQVALHHHERHDGSGYRLGLAGDEVSLLSRMAAVCDAYDELASRFSNAHRVDPEHVLRQLTQSPGKFDPLVLAAFAECIGAKPITNFV